MAIRFAVIVALLACPASAAELALLRNGFSIRHEHRLVIGDNTRLFFDGDNASFIDVPTAEIEGFEKDLTQPAVSDAAPPPALDLNQVVNSASAAYHLDPDLVNSVIHAESGFNSHAVSRKGAQGLMQLMPGTASRLGVANAFDPQSNVGGGSRYLRELLERYNFDLIKALAAYNAGPKRVEQYRGVPPYSETRAYVARIVREYNLKKIAQEKQAAAERAKTKTTTPPAPSASASQPQR
jgi:soluble lytic murein transglycosylase-like protein